jgi:hypothetical protein
MCKQIFGGTEQSSKQITRLISSAILNEDNYDDVDVFIKCSSLFIKGFDAQSYSSVREAIEERQKERQKVRQTER